jgi:hypothetical protein
MCAVSPANRLSRKVARLFRKVGDVPNLGPNWNEALIQRAIIVRCE